MYIDLKKLYAELKSVWKIAKKPTWEETKQMVIVTLLISLVVGTLGTIVFVIIQYLLP